MTRVRQFRPPLYFQPYFATMLSKSFRKSSSVSPAVNALPICLLKIAQKIVTHGPGHHEGLAVRPVHEVGVGSRGNADLGLEKVYGLLERRA